MDYYKDRIKGILNILNSERRSGRCPVTGVRKRDIGYGERETCFSDEGVWTEMGRSDTWGGTETHAAFKTKITIPNAFAGKRVTVTLNTGATDIWNTDNPQFLVYINDKIVCGHDMNHNEVVMCSDAIPGTVYDYGLYAYSNGSSASDFLILDLAAVEEDVEELYYDLKVPYEIACLMKDTDKLQGEYLRVLNDVVSILDLRDRGSNAFHASVKACDDYIKKYIYSEKYSLIERDPVSSVTVSSVGHTHIDVAWKWPLRQTREKALRSFSTVLYEMDMFPEFKFMSSQPQLYEFVKEESPEIYERIRERVREGRWETEGAMWLEADCNLASGESLIRQILFGKKFFKDEFDISDNRVMWLPDVFGYSAAMPQILKKSRIDYFMTTKIGWNEFNMIPNDTFMWKGIDGTEILTYFLTTHDYITDPELYRRRTSETTYNGRQNANQIMGCWQRYQNKDINDNVLTCFGYGDGGGGATVEMLEESRRLSSRLPGCPTVRHSHSLEFFEGLEKRLKGKKVPKWNGELYLEYHRGTYTSMARNKMFNRKCEIRNQDAETFATYAYLLGQTEKYPFDDLKDCWKIVLLNQFHDILPGSSIEDVYVDSLAQYKEAWAIEQNVIDNALYRIGRAGLNSCDPGLNGERGLDVLTVFNNTSFLRDEVIVSDGAFTVTDLSSGAPLPSQVNNEGKTVWLAKALPSKGYRTFGVRPAETPLRKETDLTEEDAKRVFETPFYTVRFNDAMEIASLFDKENGREVIRSGETGNALVCFEDIPKEYDAWNIDAFYTEKKWAVRDLSSAKVVEDGPVRTCIRVERHFNKSFLRQDIILYKQLRRIDFKTSVDWNESQMLLKAFFPFDVVTNKASYEIQYGNVERATHENTSWEQAKFEVCAHKWADVSEVGYGAALMNDCKYGYSAHESTLALTLLKAGIFPNPNADKEHHEFTYSILPHKGDFRTGNVVKESYFLNYPVYVLNGGNRNKPENSFFGNFADNVILEVVKLPENRDNVSVRIDDNSTGESRTNVSVILRMYECWGSRADMRLTTPFKVVSAFECDMLEYTTGRLESGGHSVHITMLPYEIKTVKLIIEC
ncbi:MAG: alpha-mannosidase [Lachnospiraceae bacterium]|nr:alpha-mannosidase [Lachnospiraceae bacterium]